MRANTFKSFDPNRVPSPCFVIDEAMVEHNLKLLAEVQAASGAKILSALKAFSCWSLAPLVSQYLSGTCASGLFEAQLGHDYYGGEVHVFAAAFSEHDIQQLLSIADHIVFNSISQLERFRPLIQAHNKTAAQNSLIKIGLRVNPEHSEGAQDIYNPCAAGSRLGIPVAELESVNFEGVSGLHFHTLCEQGFEPLARTVAVFEQRFAQYLPNLSWVNFGGGHLISAPDYNRQGLIHLLKRFSKTHNVQVYLEPGEAVAINSGVLVGEVLDIATTDRLQAIVDVSATCHMPDTLEMPYRADIFKTQKADMLKHTYRLGGLTCLAGDVMGDYSFDKPLFVGQRLLFDDMAHYTMVKTNTFNGVPLPAIAIWNSRTDNLRIVREFTYNDFKMRLS